MKKIGKVLLCSSLLILVASLSWAITINFDQQRNVPTKMYEIVYNSQGTPLTVGMVVVWDITTMAYTTATSTSCVAVKTTTSADLAYVAGVVVDNTIDTASWGRIQSYGYCAKVFVLAVSDTTTAGSLIGTSGTAGYCGGCASPSATVFPFGVALETSVSGTTTSIKAFLMLK